MNISPEKDPEIRALENGFQKAPGEARNLLTSLVTTITNIGRRIASFFGKKHKYNVNSKNVKNKVIGQKMDKKMARAHTKFNIKEQSKGKKPSLSKVVSRATKAANEINDGLSKTPSIDRIRS